MILIFLVLLGVILLPPPLTAASAFLTTSVSSRLWSPALISPAATLLRANTNSPSTSLLLLVSNSAAAAANDCDDKDMIARTVDELLWQVGDDDDDADDDNDDITGPAVDGGGRDGIIKDLIATLSDVGGQEEEDGTGTGSHYDFDRLLGYYNVSCSLPARPGMDNPVGGRWTRRRGGGGGRTSGRQRRWLGGLWTVSRTLQHVLPPRMTVSTPPTDHAGGTAASGDSSRPAAPPFGGADGESHPSPPVPASVAQVVNAIKLDCLWGLLCLWVVLRGDAVPLWEDQAAAAKATEAAALGSTGAGTPAEDDRNRNNNGRKDRRQEQPPPRSPLKLLPGLSNRAVRVYFDRPRIGVRLAPLGGTTTAPLLQSVLSLGPTSSVVIDTPYVDGRVRLGKGGTSGSLFVFARLLDETADADAEARDGWRWVVDGDNFNNGVRPEGGDGAAVVVASPSVLTQRRLLLHCGLRGALSVLACTLLSVVPAPQQQQHRAVLRVAKWIAASSAAVSAISFLWLACSTGGIETRRRGGTYIPGR